MSEKGVGQPTIMTPETVKVLEDGFLMGLNDSEACLYAGISKQTLYNYQHKHPEYVDRKEHLKDNIRMRAKLNVARSIESSDVTDSKWYLERKARDEFSLKQEVNLGGQNGENPVDVSLKLEFVQPKQELETKEIS